MQEHVFNYFPLLAELDMYLQCRRFASPHEVCQEKSEFVKITKLQKSRCLAQNGAVQPACLTASFIFFLLLFVFVLFCFCCFLLVKNVLHFFSVLLFLLFTSFQNVSSGRTKIVSIGYFDNEGKNLRAELS